MISEETLIPAVKAENSMTFIDGHDYTQETITFDGVVFGFYDSNTQSEPVCDHAIDISVSASAEIAAGEFINIANNEIEGFFFDVVLGSGDANVAIIAIEGKTAHNNIACSTTSEWIEVANATMINGSDISGFPVDPAVGDIAYDLDFYIDDEVALPLICQYTTNGWLCWKGVAVAAPIE